MLKLAYKHALQLLISISRRQQQPELEEWNGILTSQDKLKVKDEESKTHLQRLQAAYPLDLCALPLSSCWGVEGGPGILQLHCRTTPLMSWIASRGTFVLTPHGVAVQCSQDGLHRLLHISEVMAVNLYRSVFQRSQLITAF